MAIKPINHYSLTNPASVYDEESMTGLELAGRTAAKVNETVRAFNELEDETRRRLDNQEQIQIPTTVEQTVQRNIDDGTFDNAINRFAGDLDGRIDNLFDTYTPGGASSTTDAEVADIRYGGVNNLYTSAGAAVRDKARVKDINRFFNNDIFTGQGANLYPYDDHSFNYPRDSASTLPAIGSPFSINPGDYLFVVTDTNAKRLIINYHIGADVMTTYRVLDLTNVTPGVYSFTIPDAGGKPCYINIHYGESVENAVNNTSFYFKHAYIFPKDSVKIPREFIPARAVLDSDEVITQKGENLYTAGNIVPFAFDGKSFNATVNVTQPIKPGKYLIKINEVLPRVIITDQNENRLFDMSAMSEDEFYKFTVPGGSTSIQIIGYMSTSTAILVPAGTYRMSGITILPDDGVPFLPDYLTRFNEVEGLIRKNGGAISQGGKYLSAHGVLNAGETLYITDEEHVNNEFSIVVDMKFKGAFSYMTLGQGMNVYGGAAFYISSTDVEVISYSPIANLDSTFPHGLTIDDTLTIDIHVKDGVASYTLTCEQGRQTFTAPWHPRNGRIYVTNGSAEAETWIRWNSGELNKKVWIFGDSYYSNAPDRITGQLHTRGYKNFLVSGYPGANSASELLSLKTLLKLNKPDVIIWGLGMNNGDTGSTINPEWLTTVQTVIDICDANGVTLILATIPTVDTVNNNAKNAWVRASGRRYIDYDAAIYNIEYAISSDGVHPTQFGASRLVSRLLIDAPEIMR